MKCNKFTTPYHTKYAKHNSKHANQKSNYAKTTRSTSTKLQNMPTKTPSMPTETTSMPTKTPSTPMNLISKYEFMLFCCEAIYVANACTFGILFPGNKMGIYK